MTTSNWISSIGLVLDMIGAALIWKFGLPAEIIRSGAVLLATEQTNETEKSKARLYDRVSFWGFLLLISGFALQCASNFIGS